MNLTHGGIKMTAISIIAGQQAGLPADRHNAMPFIPIPNTVLLTAIFRDADGVEAINRFYPSTVSVPTEDDLTECAGIYTDVFTEAMVGITMSNWTLEGVICRAMNEEFGLEFVASDGVPQDGGVGSGAQPNQVSATVTWLTGLVGRSFRGRTYMVGLPLTFVASGQKQLTDTGRTNLQNAFETLRTAFETGGHALQVVSLSSGGIPRSEGVTTTILSVRANFPLATQRRRLR